MLFEKILKNVIQENKENRSSNNNVEKKEITKFI